MPSRVRPILAALALTFLAACSSRNPDALNAANVDENYAVTEANFAENVDAAAAPAPARPPVAESAANEAENSSQANIDAAVNTLREADAEKNEYCQAQKETTGESDCDDD